MKWVVNIFVALVGVSSALAFPPGRCETEVAGHDITQSVPALLAHLRASKAFQADAEALARRTIGRVRATNPNLRDSILGTSATKACQVAYALEVRTAVNRELGLLLPHGGASNEMRSQIDGAVSSKGIAVIFHQKEEFQEATAGHLSRLGELPRLAIADESDPIAGRVLSELTRIYYSRTEFPDGAWRLNPVGDSYDVHLFGGFFNSRNMAVIAERFKPLFDDERIRTINFFVYADSAYVTAPYQEVASYETLFLITDFDFSGPARGLVQPFGFVDKDEHRLSSTEFSYFNESQSKTVNVTFVRSSL